MAGSRNYNRNTRLVINTSVLEREIETLETRLAELTKSGAPAWTLEILRKDIKGRKLRLQIQQRRH